MILREVRGAERDFDAEHRASIQFAGDVDRTSVQLHQLLHQGQPDPCALNRPAPSALHAVESFKNPRELITRDARSSVSHVQDHAVSGMHLFVNPDRDAALERKLKGIAQQIEDNLFPHVAVDIDRLRERPSNRRVRSIEPAPWPTERRRPTRP